jgi:hypothetical protein
VPLSLTLRPGEPGESAGELDVGEVITEFVEVVNIGFVGEFDTEVRKEAVDVAGLEEVKMDEEADVAGLEEVKMDKEADVEELVGKSITPI